MRRLPTLYPVLLLLTIILPLPLLSSADDSIGISCEAGLDNYYKNGFFTKAVIELKNNGDEVDGEIVITGGSTDKEQIRRPVLLPRGGWKRIELSLLDYDNISSISYRVNDKEIAAMVPTEINVIEKSSLVFGNIGGINSGLRMVAGATTPKLYELSFSPDQLPSRWQSLEMFNGIILAQPYTGELRLGQQEALVDWVRYGGHLVVFVGGEYQRMRNGKWRELFPGTWQGTNSVTNLKPLADYCGSNYTLGGRTLISVPASGPGETIIQSDTGLPLVHKVQAGRGTITLMLFDPNSAAWNSWPDKNLLIEKCFGLNYYKTISYPRFHSVEDSIRRWMGQSVTRKGGGLAGFFLFCTLYVLCIGPLDYFFIRKTRKPLLTWLTFPMYIVLFSGFVYMFIYRMEAGKFETSEFRVINLANGSDEVWGTSYTGITTQANGSYNLILDQKDYAVDVQGDVSLMTTQQPLAITIGESKAECSAYMPVGTMLFFRTDWAEPLQNSFEAEISRTGNDLILETNNTLPENLNGCLLFYKDDVYSIGTIKRGPGRINIGKSDRDIKTWFNESGANNPLYRLNEFIKIKSGQFDDIYYRLCWYERWAREMQASEKDTIQALNYNDTQTDITRFWNEGQAVLLGKTDYAPARFSAGGIMNKPEASAIFRLTIPVTGGKNQ